MTWSSGTTGALTLTKTTNYPSFNELLVGLGFCAATNTNVSLQVAYDLVDTTAGSYESGIGSFNPSTNVLTRTLIQKSVTTSAGVATMVTKAATAITAASTTAVYLGTTTESTPGTMSGTGFIGTTFTSPNYGINFANWYNSASTGNPTANSEMWVPVLWLGSNSIDQMSFRLGAGTTGNCQFGIYEMLASGQPGGILWDSGSFTPTASAINTRAISAGTPTALTLSPGWYWLVQNWSAATATIYRLSTQSVCTPVGVGNYTVSVVGFTSAQTQGTLPATGRTIANTPQTASNFSSAVLAGANINLRMTA